MDKLSEAYGIVIKKTQVRNKDLSEAMGITKLEARGLIHALEWLEVLHRHDSRANGTHYTVTA